MEAVRKKLGSNTIEMINNKINKMEKIVEKNNLLTGDVYMDMVQNNDIEYTSVSNRLGKLVDNSNEAVDSIKNISKGIDELINEALLFGADFENGFSEMEMCEDIDTVFDDIYRMLEETSEMINGMISSIRKDGNTVESQNVFEMV